MSIDETYAPVTFTPEEKEALLAHAGVFAEIDARYDEILSSAYKVMEKAETDVARGLRQGKSEKECVDAYATAVREMEMDVEARVKALEEEYRQKYLGK